MGKVYEAQERLSKRRVALKVLRPELARSEQGRRMFLNEMTILAHLDHPNLVRALSCSEVEGQLVMALEYLEGQTLGELIATQGARPWMEAVAIVGQIAAGLHAAHSQDPPIIHRDLKPDNVFVLEGPPRQVKVMDFGIAKVLEVLSQTTTHSVGTLQYMSPEQIDAAPLDARADLYALGLLFYELLVGRPPFESASPRELLNMHCTQAPAPLSAELLASVPRGIVRLLFSMLEKRPADRPPSAAAVIEALDPFCVAEVPGGASTTPVSAQERVASEQVRVEPSATARRPVQDTIGIIERAAAPAMIPNRMAVAMIVALTVLAGGVSYALRVGIEGEVAGRP